MARKMYEIELEYLCREGGYDDEGADETFEYETIERELDEDEAKELLTGSFPPFDVPEHENSREVIILEVRPAV